MLSTSPFEDPAFQELLRVTPPPAQPDPLKPAGAAGGFAGPGLPGALQALYGHFGPGTFRSDDPTASRPPYVALLDGDAVTSPYDGQQVADAYELDDLLRRAPREALTVWCFAYVGVNQPGRELWWWELADDAGVALADDWEVQRLQVTPAQALLDAVQGTGAWEGAWDGGASDVHFDALSVRDRDDWELAGDAEGADDEELVKVDLYRDEDLTAARRSAVRAVRHGFLVAAPALGRCIEQCLSRDPSLGEALRARLERLPGLAEQSPWTAPFQPSQDGLHLIEQVQADLIDHVEEHALLRSIYQGLTALYIAGMLLDFFSLDELPPDGLPADLHAAFTFRTAAPMDIWLEASPASAAALAEERALIAAEMLEVDVEDLLKRSRRFWA